MPDNINQRQLSSMSEDKIILDKGYKLLRLIGEGGYAKVYLGEFKLQNEDKPILLACKVTNTAKAPSKYITKFLQRELKILMKITHPYIVQVHSIFYRKMKYYIFMRYAEQGDLLDYIRDKGVIRENQARVWARQIALGIQYLHILGIAHRDLKCENIFITANNNLKIGDFGFAKYIGLGESMTQLSETFCGSLSYVAPEVLKREPYNPRIADMWSLGVVIYTMLNRVFPFNAKNIIDLRNDQMQKLWSFRAKYAKIVSQEVVNLIGKLLEPDIKLRYKIENVLNSPWIAMDPKLKGWQAVERPLLHFKQDYYNNSI